MSKHHNKHKPQKQPHHKGTSTGHSPAATPAPSAAAAPLSLTDPHAWRFEALDTWFFRESRPLDAVGGTLLCCREAVRRMSTRHGGHGGAIVNVSSVAAKTGSPGEYVDYAASKGAMDTLTVGLAQEVAQEGIRVNAVRPGFIYTGMHADGGEPGRVDRVKAFVPMRRGGQPDEVAQAILWLLSPQASYTTGTFVDVAGGR